MRHRTETKAKGMFDSVAVKQLTSTSCLRQHVRCFLLSVLLILYFQYIISSKTDASHLFIGPRMRLPATPQRMSATTAQPSHTTAYHSNIHARSLLRPPPLAATTACSRVSSAGASLLICPLCPLVKGLSIVFDQLHCWSGLTKTAQRPGPDGGLGLEVVRSPQHPKTGPPDL
jgi:hypothetical protein